MQFKLLAQECCTITDLQRWNKGLPAEQVARQQRIVKCLVKLGHAVNEININGKDYMGPRMDEATLGHHGAFSMRTFPAFHYSQSVTDTLTY